MPSPVLAIETSRSDGRRSARTVDRPAGRGVSRGVRQEVAEDLGEVVRVGARRAAGPGASTVTRRCGPVERRLGELERRPDGRREVELDERRRRRRRVALGQRVERTRQPDEPLRLVPERVVGRPVGDDHAVAQCLEIALQVGQRRPQLVRGVGDEVAAHRLLALEAGRHLVERIGEAGELLGALARDPRRVVALGDPAGSAADLGERPGEHPGEDDGQDHAGEGATTTAARTTVVTDSSYIAWA